jgi:hypothetical protein
VTTNHSDPKVNLEKVKQDFNALQKDFESNPIKFLTGINPNLFQQLANGFPTF